MKMWLNSRRRHFPLKEPEPMRCDICDQITMIFAGRGMGWKCVNCGFKIKYYPATQEEIDNYKTRLQNDKTEG